MGYLIILLAVFISILLIMQILFFEITRNKMEKMNNINWYLSLDKPFSYNRVGYMVFICFLCYLISSPENMFSVTWFIYFILFLAMGIVADAVVQYLVLIYSKKRCRRQIEDAHLLKNELQHISQNAAAEHDYTESEKKYDESTVLRQYMDLQDHMAILSADAGEFASHFAPLPLATFVVEPYADVQKVQSKFPIDSSIKATTLTPSGQMPFKDEKMDIIMCEKCNYDKNEIFRVLKKGGYFIVNQHGTANLKEFVQFYMPFRMKGSWDAANCAQTLESIGMKIIDKFEDYGTIRFHSIQAIHQYFRKVSPDLANINKYQVFYLQALKDIRDHQYFEITTHCFLVVAQKTF